MPNDYESIHVQGDYWLMRRYTCWYPMRRTPQGSLAFLNGPSDNHDGSRESAERIIKEQIPTTLPNSQPVWFDSHGNFTGELPEDCVEDCSHAGQCYEDVKYWQARLDFQVPRELAVRYLKSTGGWDAGELAAMDDTELACKVLWIACGQIKEDGVFFGLFE